MCIPNKAHHIHLLAHYTCAVAFFIPCIARSHVMCRGCLVQTGSKCLVLNEETPPSPTMYKKTTTTTIHTEHIAGALGAYNSVSFWCVSLPFFNVRSQTIQPRMANANAIVKYGFVEVISNLLKNLSAHLDIHAH